MVRIITLICKEDKSLRLIEKITIVLKNQIEEFTIDYIDILEKKDQEIIVKIG